jgi:membrane protease YdiL (CAAX protease family)
VVWAATFLGAVEVANLLRLRDPAAAHHTLAFVGPHGPIEIVLWIVLAISAGICEEIVFRGYLQRQLIALTRSTWAGVAGAAVVFGAGHVYQGWRAAAAIALYGALLGVASRRFRDLRPGIVAHAAEDIIGGLFGH